MSAPANGQSVEAATIAPAASGGMPPAAISGTK
jgi:hypothetical protein